MSLNKFLDAICPFISGFCQTDLLIVVLSITHDIQTESILLNYIHILLTRFHKLFQSLQLLQICFVIVLKYVYVQALS